MASDAARYDRGMGLFNRLGLGPLRRRLIGDVHGEILEIGVGTGLNLPLYPAGARVTAVELDAERLSAAQMRPGAAHLVRANAEHLPLAGTRFDVVVSSLVFCSIVDPAAALAEIRRVLRPNGRLLMLEHVRGDGPVSRRLTDWLHPLWFALQGECHLNRETAALVAASGFDVERTSRHGWGIIEVIAARWSGV